MKYQVIYDDLLRMIQEGRYAPGEQIPTEQALAGQYGVSRITVRGALQRLRDDGYIVRYAGRGSFVNDLTAIRPGDAATITFVLASGEQQMLDILAGAERTLAPHHIQIHLSLSQGDAARERSIVENALDDGASGILLYPCQDAENRAYFEELSTRWIPLVYIDHCSLTIPCTCVSTDGFDGGFRATEYLIGRGHRRIGYVSMEGLDLETMRHRYSGYLAAMNKHALEPATLVAKGDEARFIREAGAWLTGASPPTAVLTLNDNMAYLFYRLARDLNLVIPDRLSVIGFDNLATSEQIVPPLTTMAQPFADIGAQAASLLLNQINGSHRHTRQYLSVRLVERASVATIITD